MLILGRVQTVEAALEARIAVGGTQPASIPVGGSDSVNLCGYLYDPDTHKEVQLADTQWKWSISSVDRSLDNSTWTPATSGYTASLDTSTAQCVKLISSFSNSAYWVVTVSVTATYHDPDNPATLVSTAESTTPTLHK